MPDFTFYGGRNNRQQIFVSLSKLECSPQEIDSRGTCLHLTFSVNWNKHDKVKKTQIHFRNDLFADVTVTDAKAP